MDINSNIYDFMKEIYEHENHRYTSWEICFEAFKDRNLDDKTKALHLSGFLCSWGMYRGKGKLLKSYNYLIFKDLIPTLNNYKDLRVDFLEENVYNKFLYLVGKIEEYLSNLKISSTHTLVTKVILGVYGCFPALDQYFLEGYKRYGYKFSTNIFKRPEHFAEFYDSLKSFYSANKILFENERKMIKRTRKINYTPMKLIDMCFWNYGKFFIDCKKFFK